MHCEKKAYVAPWTVLKIQPRNVRLVTRQTTQEENEDNWEYEYDGDCMADLVQVGDNFAVAASENNDEGVSFYILQCQIAKHIVQEDFDCVWEGTFKLETLSFVVRTTRSGNAMILTTMCTCGTQGRHMWIAVLF